MRKLMFTLKPNEQIVKSFYIHWVDTQGNNHLVGRLTYLTCLPDYRYVIEYFHDCLKNCILLDGFFGISGCSFSYGKEVFIYENKIPIFVKERCINPKRNDLPEILSSLGMKYYDRLEFLEKTNGICSDNKFFLSSEEDASNFWNKFLHYYRSFPRRENPNVQNRKAEEKTITIKRSGIFDDRRVF